MINDASLDIDEFSKRRAQMQYPNLTIEEPNATTTSIIPNLEKGEMLLMVRFNGERRVAGYISRSAYNIDKLLRTHSSVVYAVSKEQSSEIREIKDYLEVVTWI